MSPAELRVGLVGCGRMAREAYLPALGRSPRFRLSAVADRDAARARELAPGAGAAVHAGAEEMACSGEVDALIICTPAPHHPAGAAVAAAAGLPSLVEKPPAVDADGAAMLAALDPPPWIGLNRRFSHALAPGAAPPGSEIRLSISYRRASWRAYEVRDDALADLGCHLADLALRLGGRAEGVRCALLEPERAELELRLAGGRRAFLEARTDRVHRELVEVRRAGELLARSAIGGRVAALAGRLRPGPHPLMRSVELQLDAFGRAVAGEDPGPLASAADGVAAMRILDAARRSAAAGGEGVAP